MEKVRFYLYHRTSDVRVLGPGVRYAIWTQGCKHYCKNCIAPDSHPIDRNGYWIEVDDLFEEVKNEAIKKNLRGVTISGGEPFLQITPLKVFIQKIKENTNLDIICYSGFTYKELLRRENDDINYILSNIDILIDGKYIEEKNENNYLRGSSNQKLNFLSNRYKKYEKQMMELKNRNLEYTWDENNELFVIGIPSNEMEDK